MPHGLREIQSLIQGRAQRPNDPMQPGTRLFRRRLVLVRFQMFRPRESVRIRSARLCEPYPEEPAPPA